MPETDDTAKKSTLYTRTGDKGSSSLYNGERRAKTDTVFEALGTVDELSSSIGIANHYCERASSSLCPWLHDIQCRLFEIGANIATPRHSSASAPHKIEKTQFDQDGGKLRQLERWIDDMDSRLPKLTNFIMPSGGEAAVFLHQCRTVSRRAERVVVPLVRDGEADDSVGQYLNRLSDFFFAAARTAAKETNAVERVFTSNKLEERAL
ncbi:hypothetical protein RI367_005752 [Sorochytrium milnesiophthora]